MRNIIKLFLILFVAFSVFGCSSGTYYNTNSPKIDANKDLKRVYIHSVSASNIEQTYINHKGEKVNLDQRIDAAFFRFLKQELRKRGIVLVISQDSPYTWRADFKFTKFGVSHKNAVFDGKMSGKLALKNINYSKNFTINSQLTQESVNKSEISNKIDLLAQALASRAADHINQLK